MSRRARAAQRQAEQDEARLRLLRRYERGLQYHASLLLDETVRQNENFYIGRQWEGVNAPDLDKPVLNILGRVVNYLVATVTGEAIGVSCEAQGEENAALVRAAQSELRRSIEQNDLNALAKELMRDAAVDGDACLHLWYDPAAPTDQGVNGCVRIERLENTDVFFGNPQLCEVEGQPWLIIASRRPVGEVRAELHRRGGAEWLCESVTPDAPYPGVYSGEGEQEDCVTVLTQYEKRNGTVWLTQTTKTALLLAPTDTLLRRYPLTWMCWQRVRHSYHGQAAVSGLIPNQIAINKLFAMCIKQTREYAFPKLMVDRTKIERWSNRIGVIEVNGDPSSAAVRFIGGGEISAQTLLLIDRLIAYTRDLMGASDAALGNVNPQNTSAIVAVQKSTTVPLELQRRGFRRMMEETVRALLELITVNYGLRRVRTAGENGQEERWLDFSALRELLLGLRVDVGAAAFWSELTQIQTLENLLRTGVITDTLDYLEAMPEDALPGKHRLIAALRERRRDEKNNTGEEMP